MRTCYDSITAADIPASAALVAGYVEGSFAWSAADWARFPNAVQITIAVWSADADALDVENGDATPSMVPSWIQRQLARGPHLVPIIYCNLDTWPLVQSACSRAGLINGTHYDWWAASYTGIAHLEPGSAATQYADPAAGSGGHYDVSLCQDWWPRHEGQDMTNDEHNWLSDVHSGMGSLVSYGGPQPPVAIQTRDLALAIQAQLKILQTPSIDVDALATSIVAKLPPTTGQLDPAVLAKAVVDEIGARVRPAAA